MRLKAQKKQFVREIERTWRRVPYSKQVSDILEYRDDDFEYNETKSQCLGKNWWEIPDEYFDYGYASPFFLRGEAFHYFLPAFLLYAIKDDWTMERLLNGRFFPPKNDSFESFTKEFSNYSTEEKQCILHFLEYAKSYYAHKNTEFNQRKIRQIDDAVDRYWRMGIIALTQKR